MATDIIKIETLGDVSRSGGADLGAHRYLCFFTHGAQIKGVVPQTEWEKNPDSGIKDLIKRHKAETSPFGLIL